MTNPLEPTVIRVSIEGTDKEIVLHVDSDDSASQGIEAVLKVAGEVTDYDYSGGSAHDDRQIHATIGRWIVAAGK